MPGETAALHRLALNVLQPGFAGTEMPDWVRQRIDEGLGSVLLFGRNVRDAGQLASLTAALHAENPGLVIAIDEEGGDVTRLEATSGSSYPGNLALGAVDDLELTRRVARSLGRRLVEAGIEDAEVLCAAALHDVLEDCCGPGREWTLDEGRALLGERFGGGVLALVEAVTDDKALPKDARKRLQVEHAAHAPHGAKLVKLADKIANLRDLAATPPADWSPERRREYFAWAKTVVDNLRGTHPVLEQLFAQAHDQPA